MNLDSNDFEEVWIQIKKDYEVYKKLGGKNTPLNLADIKIKKNKRYL